MSSLLKIDNLDMYFKGTSGGFFKKKTNKVGAVVDVSFDIEEGQIMALVGESGCGKTTIGKIIVGLFNPTGGSVVYKGKNVKDMNKSEKDDFRREVQMVHQDSYAALNPARTLFNSLKDPMMSHGIVKTKDEAYNKLVELFQLVGLTPAEQFIEKYPHQLSGGQRQRVLLARALSVKPKLIVADEPVSMVDVSLRISLLDLMAKMNKEMGISFIYITHDLATARYIGQNGKIGVMYLGKLVETGPLQTVLDNPRHPYLQALISAIPVPDLKISRGKRQLPLKSLEMPNPANPPSGCRFNPRCIYATEICERECPELKKVGEDLVACHEEKNVPKWIY
ncbi:MAG: ABC transporter ATP-binding protein [Cellulosilyticaceae bacterium]